MERSLIGATFQHENCSVDRQRDRHLDPPHFISINDEFDSVDWMLAVSFCLSADYWLVVDLMLSGWWPTEFISVVEICFDWGSSWNWHCFFGGHCLTRCRVDGLLSSSDAIPDALIYWRSKKEPSIHWIDLASNSSQMASSMPFSVNVPCARWWIRGRSKGQSTQWINLRLSTWIRPFDYWHRDVLISGLIQSVQVGWKGRHFRGCNSRHQRWETGVWMVTKLVTEWWPNGEQMAASCCQNVNSSEKWKVATKVVDGRVADVHCRMANGGIASTPLRFWRFGHFEMETEWSNRRHSMPWISHEFPMNRLGIDWMTVIDSIQLDLVIDWIVLWIGQRTTKANSLAANPSCLLHPPNRHNHKMIQPKPKLFDFFQVF